MVTSRLCSSPAMGRGYRSDYTSVFYRCSNSKSKSVGATVCYQRDPSRRDILETLLTYNREDCVAIKSVEEWLRRL